MQESETKGVRTACLYSYGCPELKEPIAKRVSFNPSLMLLYFLQKPSEINLYFVLPILKMLDPFFCYQLIAFCAGSRSFFDPLFVRSHWIPNGSLRDLTRDDIERAIAQWEIPRYGFNFQRLMAIRLKIEKLAGGKPHHNFVVLQLLTLFLRNGQIPSKVLKKANDCLVRPAVVIETRKKSLLIVHTKAVIFNPKRETLSLELRKATVKGKFLNGLKQGDIVSVHFGIAREKITSEESAALLEITEQALRFYQQGRE